MNKYKAGTWVTTILDEKENTYERKGVPQLLGSPAPPRSSTTLRISLPPHVSISKALRKGRGSGSPALSCTLNKSTLYPEKKKKKRTQPPCWTASPLPPKAFLKNWDITDIRVHNHSSLTNASCSIAKLCLTLCNPMDCSTSGFPVHHQLPELMQTHVHWVSDAIQPSHPLLLPSFALNLFQHQAGSFPMSWLFASGGQSIGVSASAAVLPMNIQGWFLLGLAGLISL